MAKEYISLETKFGQTLIGIAWTIEQPKENVVIVTGMEEKAERYDAFANFLNENGFNVYCVDHYGQGLNVNEEHPAGIVPSSFFSKSVKNIDQIVTRLRASLLPTTIFAHSMGSFMGQDYIQRFTQHVNKVIICGSNGKNAKGIYPLARFLASFGGKKGKHRNELGKFMSSLSFGGYNKKFGPKGQYQWLSRDEAIVEQYTNDPLCGYGSSKGFYYEFMKGLSRIYKREFLKKIRKDMHILVIAGKDDPVGAYGKGPANLAAMYKKLGIEDVTLKLYPEMRHEILNEIGKEEVYGDILAFLNKEVEPAEEILKF